MYGGGSLAIYINGVAQELLKMVQATATNLQREDNGQTNGKTVSKTTDVYRKIAFLLSDKEKLNEFSKIADKTKLKTEIEDFFVKTAGDDEPNVSFIIDVLTGSSAGGINAVYLSKALVNGVDGMDNLQQLWIEQGDFAKLLNDKKSVADNQLKLKSQPTSLLNSQRMYLELLKALDGMDEIANKEQRLVEELDLYVTYTDFRGIPLPMFLSDKSVLERRHKHVFNFRFSNNGINDFEIENNPFLAFAARTTSSFPFAFEPSQLTDIDEILQSSMPTYESGNSKSSKWKKYFRDLTDEHGNPIEWKTRSFVDGGALDNKPFGYAIDKLTQRADEGIVHRKLLYIEPAPEDLSNERNNTEKPNAIANLLAQGVNLPRYETIREDLQRLLERNRLIRRMNRITNDVERDFEKNFDKLSGEIFPDFLEWADAGFNDIAKYKGLSAVPYYRLRISALTDDIAGMATAYFRVDKDSDYFKVLRSIIAAWRDSVFAENRPEETGQTPQNSENGAARKVRTLNKFLNLYDVEYRFRRLRFIMRKIEDFLRRPDEIHEQLLNYSNEKIVENLLSRPDENADELLNDARIADLREKYRKARGNAKFPNVAEFADKNRKTETESGTAVDSAINRQEGVVLQSAAMFNNISTDKVEEKETLKRMGAVKVENLPPEDKNLEELMNKRSVIGKMDFRSGKFINEATHIQKQVNKIYQRLRLEYEYLHTGLENSQLADDLLKELDKKARLSDKTAKDKEFAENNLQNFILTLGDVEQELQSLEILQQKEDGATPEETAFKQDILDKNIRIQENQRERKDTHNKPEILSKQEERILKELSFAALQRILRYLKKDKNPKTADSDEKTYGASSENGREALKDAYGDGYKNILKALNNSAFFLEGFYNEPDHFISRADGDMDKLLNIKKEDPTIPADDNSNFIRDYLKVYYPLYDSYDQISFPVYFETSVGEAVEVDIVRISSRDAHSLINEEEPKEKRRKLAGDALYAFGAFLDPRWRLNDIMWGRLDGAERLITTLLPDEDYENLRDVLIEEANRIILRETILVKDSPAFRSIVVNSLTLAGTEAIIQKAADRLVSGLTAENINKGLTAAFASSLEEEVLFEQIKTNYEVNRTPEPQPTLKILSRATQVSGKILEGISEETGRGSGGVSWIAKLGQVFWGLVIVAAPNSIWNLLFVYWLQVLYFFEACLIIGGALLSSPQVQQFGFISFLVTMIVHLTTLVFHDYMRGRSFIKLILYGVGIIAGLLAITGMIFIYAYLYDDGYMWKEMVGLRETYLINTPRFNKFFPSVALGVFLLSVLAWRSIWSRAVVEIGITLLVFSAAILGFGVFFSWFNSYNGSNTSVFMPLEFVTNADQVYNLVGEAGSKMRLGVKTSLLVDTFGFVPVYTILFLLLSQLLSFRIGDFFKLKHNKDKETGIQTASGETFGFKQLANPMSVSAAFLALAAASADCIENYFTYRIMSVSTENLKGNSSFLFERLYDASHSKWIAVFLCVFLLSFIFLRWQKSFYGLDSKPKSILGGVLLNLTFLIMLTAPFIGFWGLYYNQTGIQIFSSMLLAGGIFAGFTMLYYRQRFLVGF